MQTDHIFVNLQTSIKFMCFGTQQKLERLIDAKIKKENKISSTTKIRAINSTNFRKIQISEIKSQDQV